MGTSCRAAWTLLHNTLRTRAYSTRDTSRTSGILGAADNMQICTRQESRSTQWSKTTKDEPDWITGSITRKCDLPSRSFSSRLFSPSCQVRWLTSRRTSWALTPLSSLAATDISWICLGVSSHKKTTEKAEVSTKGQKKGIQTQKMGNWMKNDVIKITQEIENSINNQNIDFKNKWHDNIFVPSNIEISCNFLAHRNTMKLNRAHHAGKLER